MADLKLKPGEYEWTVQGADDESEAVLYLWPDIGPLIRMRFNRASLLDLIRGAQAVRDDLAWRQARWLSATVSGSKEHLVRKGDQDPEGPVLCGRRPGRGYGTWRFWPMLEQPIDRLICRTCAAIWRKYETREGGT